MYKLKCPACGDTHTVKNGKRKGVQTYVCRECGYQFRNNERFSQDGIWRSYQYGKQTVSELASSYGVSDSTIKRRLRGVAMKWVQPQLSGEGFVHIDATYWGHNWGVMLALDDESGKPLYLEFIAHEKVQDFVDAVRSIEGAQLCHKGNRDRRDEKPVRRVRELQDPDVSVPHDTDSKTIPYPAP